MVKSSTLTKSEIYTEVSRKLSAVEKKENIESTKVSQHVNEKILGGRRPSIAAEPSKCIQTTIYISGKLILSSSGPQTDPILRKSNVPKGGVRTKGKGGKY